MIKQKIDLTPEKTLVTTSNKFREFGLPIVFYLIVAIAFTWPLAINLSNRVILAESGDVWQHLWNNWWMRFSALDLHRLPYVTPMLFYPTNPKLFFHALDPMDGYLSTPLQVIFGNVSAFNLIVLLQVTLAGFGTYLLARYLTTKPLASLVAGLIYACSPLESRLIDLGQLELSSIEWLPFYILCFLKALNHESRPWWWRGLSVGFLLILSLDSWYYTLYACIFSGIYTLYKLWQERDYWQKTLVIAIGIITTYSLIVSPLLIQTIAEAGKGGTQQPILNVIYSSATIKGLFTTGPSLLWGIFGSSANSEFRGGFLGYGATALALLGLATSFRKNWVWAIVAGFFLVMAFGPVLHWHFDPTWTIETADNGRNLPGRLLYNLPFGNIVRVPLRFTLVAMLALAILATYGLGWLQTKIKFQILQWAVFGLIGLLIFLEFTPNLRTLADTSVPEFYTKLQNEGAWDSFAIMETPERSDASVINKAMYYQTVHHHPILEGYLSRKPDYEFRNTPGIFELLTLQHSLYKSDIIDRASVRNALFVLNYYNIRYVVVHPSVLPDKDSQFKADELLKTVFGSNLKPTITEPDLEAWRVTDFLDNQTEPVARLLPQLGTGWSGRTLEHGGPERNLPENAVLHIFNPNPNPIMLHLKTHLRLNSDQSTRVSLWQAGQELQAVAVDGIGTDFEVNIQLAAGLNSLTFKTTHPVWVGVFNFAKP